MQEVAGGKYSLDCHKKLCISIQIIESQNDVYSHIFVYMFLTRIIFIKQILKIEISLEFKFWTGDHTHGLTPLKFTQDLHKMLRKYLHLHCPTAVTLYSVSALHDIEENELKRRKIAGGGHMAVMKFAGQAYCS